MKLKRKSGLTIGIAALSAVALTSVGFASWLISGEAKVTSEANITAESISRNHLLTIGWVTAAGSTIEATPTIKYGVPANANTAGWLHADSATQTENLVAYLRVEISGAKDETITNVLETPTFNSTGGGTVYLINNKTRADFGAAYTTGTEGYNSETSTKTGYAGAANTGFGHNINSHTGSLVASAPALTYVDSDGTQTTTLAQVGETDNGVFWLKVEFKWGTLFGENSTNPYTYYSGKDRATYAAEAYDVLSALDTLLTSAKYTLTLSSK